MSYPSSMCNTLCDPLKLILTFFPLQHYFADPQCCELTTSLSMHLRECKCFIYSLVNGHLIVSNFFIIVKIINILFL